MRVPELSGSTRTIWILGVTAVISLGAGLGLSKLIVSPSEAAANAAPPEAGQITVPVEQRTLSNEVIMRADAIYEDPVQVTIEAGDIGGPAVVTGRVPEVGTELAAGDVALEVTGRPVIVLTGDLPVYRTLRAGVSGPDVLQLKAALAALGIDPGNESSDTYDSATAAAVRTLYTRVGYPAPSAGPEAEAAIDIARDMVRSAEEQVASAKRALDLAKEGIPDSERIRLEGNVTIAQKAYDDAVAACAEPDPTDCAEVVAAQVDLDVAAAVLAEALASVDTAAERSAYDAARRALSDARADLAEAQQGVLTPMPASEVIYLANTPRRVDTIDVRRGSMIAGSPVMSVSGATLQLTGTLSRSDADLITEGSQVLITMPDGSEITGTVESLGGESPVPEQPGMGEPDPNRERVIVIPDDITEEQRFQIYGMNVRVRIPVSATEGEVLAVPIAAVTAGPGGESRVEVVEDGVSRLVTVQLGLAAGGYVEVAGLDGPLEVGDRVVVGVTTNPQEDTSSEDDDGGREAAG